MRGKGVGLLLREDIEVVVVSFRNLCEKVGVRRGRGVGRGKGGGGRCRERREGEGGMGVRRRSGGRGGGRGKAGGGAEGRRKGEYTRRPVDARIVANQPREAEDKLEVAEPHDMTGKVFCVNPMYP